ncbi:LemA protein [Nitratiruptor sp. YY08-26]|uniref:LemA family protein n=1 Tax=unclassified Nitratiruptor TaxID=2624044 RepID=UPI0019162AC6|nr:MULTISPECIES: LemA family protein [unclassified Nitratiruptor]BCD61313.1 LemA protein [Nitratiruptor sp. YY08-13]BCD65246.1 LemA protein [Nitratiruptor sp. YY08-26]
MAFWIFLAIVAGIIVYFISVYNGLVALRERAEAAWSDIDVQLKRRHDLIPALVDTVKGYMDYEKSTLKEVIEARNQSQKAASLKEKADAEEHLSSALGHIFALAESYPELKANTTFLQLQQELSNIEEALQNARRYYNAVVRDYNAKIDSFPDMLIAKRYGFTPKEYFELEDAKTKEMPKIEL